MRFARLQDWLDWQEGLHPTTMDLGLARVAEVAARMAWPARGFALVVVAGTNGKGSTVAYLEAALMRAGHRVGTYTSPHLLRYNERIRIAAQAFDDEAIMAAFAALDQARGELTLTYFEFGTLAAMHCFYAAQVDVAVMEVGIGGRLDAVNVFDADVAVVTTVDLDHQKWLGDDRESIGREKAGILRAGRPAVSAERAPPAALYSRAEELGAPLYVLGRDHDYRVDADGSWHWHSALGNRVGLPAPGLAGRFQYDNAAGALMALTLLEARLPLDHAALCLALRAPGLQGRFQCLQQAPELIVDVAHNPQACAALADNLRAHPCAGRSIAVLGMFADKAMLESMQALRGCFQEWHLFGLDGPRGDDGRRLEAALLACGATGVRHHASLGEALAAACDAAGRGDRIVAFGSFHVAGDVLARAQVT